MGLKTDLGARVDDVLSTPWSIRDGRVVPKTEDVNLSNGAVKLEAVYVYADLADSTTLARDFDRRIAARVVRSYLYVMARLIVSHKGEVRSFDGDRVMGIFIGDYKCTTAAKCCLQMKWAFTEIIRSKVESKYPSLKDAGYTLDHSAGADLGEVLVVRAGVRDSNDLISVGGAPNIAARLSDLRVLPYRSFITSSVYARLNDEAKVSSGKPMWETASISVKGNSMTIYRSLWGWVISG